MMDYAPGRDGGETVMQNHMTVFVKMDNGVAESFVKALDWLIRLLVGTQLADASSSAQRLMETVAKEPARVYETLRRSPGIPETALEEFRRFFLAGGRRHPRPPDPAPAVKPRVMPADRLGRTPDSSPPTHRRGIRPSPAVSREGQSVFFAAP
ncbi:MAG: hypothetical protein HYY21_03580 [Candidatus Tectomicrobia bacterium]|nr:hypothetical protein [Candidatus Tectomicrobia bacterium]